MINKYIGLKNYLEYLTKEYKLKICINDFAGFLFIDEQLGNILQPFLLHNNSFCMKIKSNEELFKKCLRMKRKILIKCEKEKKTFYGMCYCGIEEYIVPIITNNIVLGFICVGVFNTNKQVSLDRIKQTAKTYGLNYEVLFANFKKSTEKIGLDLNSINSIFGILSEYLSEIYSTLSSTHEILTFSNINNSTDDTSILSHALEYIKLNYKLPISINDISKACYCSNSYISHIFKKNIRVNVKSYLNKIRIEKSKILLISTTMSISNIALDIGFNDSNYFSTVFKKLCVISPSDFRDRFQN